jgi:hypothetical protein
MAIVKRVVLDVLKPHQPNALEFACELADLGSEYHVDLLVMEVDDKTQTIELTISADDINYGLVSNHIKTMGGAIHSIDEVAVMSSKPSEAE